MKPFALLAGLSAAGLFFLGKKSGAATMPALVPSGSPALLPKPPSGGGYVPAPSPTSGGTLREGMRGPAVAEWQGFLGVTQDGVFGTETKKATILFQMSKGLSPDGVVGPDTRAAASAEGTHLSPPPEPTVTPVVTPVMANVPNIPSDYVAARPTPELNQYAAQMLALGDPVGTIYKFNMDGKLYIAAVMTSGGKRTVGIFQPENQA